MVYKKDRLGLALSGGGYRAAAFHLGTLKKLNELGLLSKVDVLSTISGGSITGAAWCLYTGDYNSFHEEMITKLTTKSIIKYILISADFIFTALFMLIFLLGSIYLTFTKWPGYSFLVLGIFVFLFLKLQFKIFPVSGVIERAYDKFFFHNKTLTDLNDKPVIAIGSSNLQTGRPFNFSQMKMSDSTYLFGEEYTPPIRFKHEFFPIARAVMASSCVPFAFTPIIIEKQFFEIESDYNRISPVLIDGGIYDNQGIQKITQSKSSYECDIIITSDAGGNFIAGKKFPNTIALLIHTVDLFMYRIKISQMVQNIYHNLDSAKKPIAYFSLGWKIQNAIPGFVNNLKLGLILNEIMNAHGFKPEWMKKPGDYEASIIKHLEDRLKYSEIEKRNLKDEQWEIARSTRTNLKCLTTDQVNYLIRHAENLTEIQVKLYCPNLISQHEVQ